MKILIIQLNGLEIILLTNIISKQFGIPLAVSVYILDLNKNLMIWPHKITQKYTGWSRAYHT